MTFSGCFESFARQKVFVGNRTINTLQFNTRINRRAKRIISQGLWAFIEKFSTDLLTVWGLKGGGRGLGDGAG